MSGDQSWFETQLTAAPQLRFGHKLVDQLFDGFFVLDARLNVLHWNRGAERLTGLAAADVVGRSCDGDLALHCDEEGRPLSGRLSPAATALADGKPQVARLFLRRADGSLAPVIVRAMPLEGAEGGFAGVVESLIDDAENYALRSEVAKLARVATTDALTALPNRRGFDDLLEKASVRCDRYGCPFGLALMDLDHFKDINDQFGHGAGDQLLQAVARALSFVRRRDETVGRWGGEEFAVLIQPVAGRLELAAAVERLRTIVPRARIVAGEDLVHVTASAGAALARPGERLENLWSRVDRLLYQSKREGRDRLALEDDAD